MRDESKSRKINLYLPVEIKAREFNSKVLLALCAANKGFRVYLGSKHAVDGMLGAQGQKNGIYFYKSGNLRDRFENIYSRCESLVVLDEEMGVAVREIEFYYSRRVSDAQAIARYFVISDRHKRVVTAINPDLSRSVTVTGWPRVDLWRPELSGLYEAAVTKIQEVYSDYVLFSSDFGFVGDSRIQDELERLRNSGTAQSEIDLLEQKWRAALNSYRKFVVFLREFDRHARPYQIIVRPHPAEDHRQWHSDLRGLNNVKVIYEGEIGPWLLAAKALLHRGCTTAVQAVVSNKPSLFWYMDEDDLVREDMLPYKLSTKITSLDELDAAVREIVGGRYIGPALPDDFSDELYIGERLAVELIVDELLKVAASPVKKFTPSILMGCLNRLAGKVRDVRLRLGITKNKSLRDRYLRKLPGGITAKEVRDVSSKIGLPFHVKIRQVRHNLVEFECEKPKP